MSVSITRLGQKARLLFSGTATQRVSLSITGVTGSADVRLLKSDGSLISGYPNFSQTTVGAGGGFLGTYTLPTTAPDYAIYLIPSSGGTASATFTLYNVPPDVTGTLTINGPAAPVNITVPGQNSSFTFTGTAGQVVSLRGASNTIGCGNFVLIWPNGSVTATQQCGATFSMNATLQSGTHTLVFDPSGSNTGSVNLSVTQP